jgi:hypothetical protein
MRRYLTITFSILLALCTAVTGFNAIVDPYSAFGSPLLTGINHEKPALSTGERVYKSRLARMRADTVILGTSRSEVGLDPRSRAFRATQVINLATSNQPYRETLELLELASQHGVRRAIVGFDFFAANDFRRYPPSYQPGIYASPNHWMLAASMTTLQASMNTVRNQDPKALAAAGAHLREDGMRLLGDAYVRAHGGHAQLFADTVASYLRDSYPYADAFGLDTSGSAPSEMICALRIFEFAHTNGIELHVFVSPSHAWMWEALYQAGLWGKWEAWKRRLVELEHHAATQSGAPSFTITDFSGFNAFTTEEVPAAMAVSQTMRWYIEASHYRPELGEIVLQRLLGKQQLESNQANFGTPLTTEGITAALSDIRADHARWRSNHLRDVSAIASQLSRSEAARWRNAGIRSKLVNQGCS